jgi:superfamily II DNA or RNA helicase
MIKLRNYQEKCISALRTGLKSNLYRQILCAATGAGKTVMFTYMVSRAVQKGNKCLIITHRTELFTQAGGTISNFNIEVTEVNPKVKNLDYNKSLYVAMAQTLKRRLKDEAYLKWFNELDLIIIDEAHLEEFNTLLPLINEKTKVIGATATPYRNGNQKSLNEFYNNLVDEVSISYLIDNGFLATPHSYGVQVDLKGVKSKGGDYDENRLGKHFMQIKLFKGVIENYKRICDNKKTLIFAANIESSKQLVQEFINQGYDSKHIDGYTSTLERKLILNWFKNTPNAILSNYGILTAGFDEPSIEVVILYRATKSLPLFLQMVGRGSRTTPTKKDFTILDFGNNIQRLGFWQQDRKWSLEKEPKKRTTEIAPVKNCNCGAILKISVSVCPYCYYEFPKPKLKEPIEVKLERLKDEDIRMYNQYVRFLDYDKKVNEKGYKLSLIHI